MGGIMLVGTKINLVLVILVLISRPNFSSKFTVASTQSQITNKLNKSQISQNNLNFLLAQRALFKIRHRQTPFTNRLMSARQKRSLGRVGQTNQTNVFFLQSGFAKKSQKWPKFSENDIE